MLDCRLITPKTSLDRHHSNRHIPFAVRCAEITARVVYVEAIDEEIEEVRKCLEWQAPDLEVTCMQKVYSEAVQITAWALFGRRRYRKAAFGSAPPSLPGRPTWVCLSR